MPHPHEADALASGSVANQAVRVDAATARATHAT